MLYANSEQIEITPALGTLINGEFTSRFASNIADPLFAKALYLKEGGVEQLFIVVDICVMKRDFLDEIKKEISQETGIPASHQMIASTHTHHGGSVADLLLAQVDLAYRKVLHNKLVELAKRVISKSVASKVAFQKIEKPEHLTCRRYNMDSSYQAQNPVSGSVDEIKTNPFGAEHLIVSRSTIPDPEVCYIAVKSLEDKWIGLLANYNLHYVGDCPRSTITADYFGYFARRVQHDIGDDEAVIMMSNGTSGEVNIWDFINGDRYSKEYHAKSKLIGEDIAVSISKQFGDLDWITNPSLEVLYEDMRVSVRDLEEDLFKSAVKTVQQTDYELVKYTDSDLMEKVYAREQVLLAEVEKPILFPIQCFKIGPIQIGALGGEFFSETGKKLKNGQDKYFTICLANDYVGYVPPKEEFAKGGYETWRARSCFLAEDAEERICTKLKEIIKDLK